VARQEGTRLEVYFLAIYLSLDNIDHIYETIKLSLADLTDGIELG
jgi:hypothetical protein